MQKRLRRQRLLKRKRRLSAVKMSSVKKFQAQVPNSNIVETNKIYNAARYDTAGHREAIKTNGGDFCEVDIMGGFGGSLKNIAIGCASGHEGKVQFHHR